jgi:hypothetical protein
VTEHAERIRAHVETHLGPVAGIVNAGPGYGIDLDIFHVDATETKPFHVLVTCGMSDRPMSLPEEVDDVSPLAELVLGLDASWPFAPENIGDDRYGWPLKLLASLARLPHAHELWFGPGHTVPNGNPPSPYIEGTELCGVLLAPLVAMPPDFGRLDLGEEGTLDFIGVVPVYAEEMKLKLDRGTEALFERFDAHQINEILVPNRRKVAGGVFELL